MKVRWSEKAKNDLLEIGRYIAGDKTGAARKWVETLRQSARKAGDYPYLGRRVPEWDRNDMRELILRGYRIVYLIKDGSVEILTIIEGHRLLQGDPLA